MDGRRTSLCLPSTNHLIRFRESCRHYLFDTRFRASACVTLLQLFSAVCSTCKDCEHLVVCVSVYHFCAGLVLRFDFACLHVVRFHNATQRVPAAVCTTLLHRIPKTPKSTV